MPRRTVVFLAGLSLLACALVPVRAEAQSHAEAVWTQLNRAYEQVNGEGFNSRNYVIGRTNNGGSDSWTFTLPGGNSYKIIGVCDNDCDDLDIKVSEGDRTVAEDILDDDVPIVNFSAKNETRFVVKVTMASCKSEPCFFGIGIFYK